jgi:ABC-type Fe3+ transport system permease subunit
LRHRSSSASKKAPATPKHQLQLHASCNNSGETVRSHSTCQQQQQQHQQQQQQQQQGATSQPQPLLLRMLHLLFSWLSSLFAAVAPLLGLQCSSSNSSSSSSSGGGSSDGWSSSSSSWGSVLWAPVPVAAVGGFTVAGLDGGENGAGPVTETLVTSILKVCDVTCVM